MVIDYKGVSFSFKDQKRKRLTRRLRIAVLLFVLVCLTGAVALWLDSGTVSGIQELLLENKLTEAGSQLRNEEGSFFHPKSKKELNGLLLLCGGKLNEAAAFLAGMDGRSTSVDFEAFLSYFADNGRYRELKIYTDYLVKGGEDLFYYRALYNTALFDPAASDAALAKMDAGAKETHQKELGIIRNVNQQLKTGKFNYIFDVNGLPMAYFDLKTKQTVSLTPGMTFDAFHGEILKGINLFSLTLDLKMHEILHQLFKKERGTFLLFNLADSSIAAAYSKAVEKEWQGRNSVFSQLYEPGSIIKVLTLFAYLKSGEDKLFPYDCRGTCPIAGQTFFDWFRHGNIDNFEEALAVSCNISFARMGMQLGVAGLTKEFEHFFFNKGEFKDQFLQFKTGSCNKKTSDNYQLANLSVGLNEISISTFHAAFCSAVIARNGSVDAPYLIKNKKNLLNLGFYNHKGELLQVSDANAEFVKVKNAMLQVVEDDRGTGRRTRVDFVQTGIKTGTAGDKKVGLDAVITGFFPMEKPQYAFAFRLERAGKAELKGAYFFKRFLTSVYHQE